MGIWDTFPFRVEVSDDRDMQVSELLALWKNVRTAQVAYRQALIDRRPVRQECSQATAKTSNGCVGRTLQFTRSVPFHGGNRVRFPLGVPILSRT